MTIAAPPTSFDEVPYVSLPFAQTHPDSLAALATLLGMEPTTLWSRLRSLGISSEK